MRRARALRERLAALEAVVIEAAAPPAGMLPTNVATRGASPSDPSSWLWAATVTRAEAMAVPVLAFIRHQLAGGVASMSLDRYRTGADGEVVELPAGWCAEPDPAPTIPVSVFFAWIVDDLFFGGTSTLVALARDATGYPVAFRRVLPGQLSYDPTTLAWGMAASSGQITYLGAPVDPADVIVINGPHEGICNYGAGPIRAALDLEAAAGTAAAEPVPNVELHQTSGEQLSSSAAEDLVTRYRAARARGATAYTPAHIETKVHGYSSADQQIIEGRQYTATQLARLAGVNPVLVSAAMGAASSYVYTNQADYRQAFLDDVLDAYLRAIEGRLSAPDVTPRGQSVIFDRDAFTRPTLLDRANVLLEALRVLPPAAVPAIGDALGLDLPTFALEVPV